MKIKTQAKNFARAYLERLRDGEPEPFDYGSEDAIESVMDDLERALSEEEVREQVLRELVQIALRDADRELLKYDGARARRVQVGVEPLFLDLDPLEVIALGDRRRIAIVKARFEHLDENDDVETENNVAQNEAFRRKWRRNQALKNALRPLDPRATVADVISDVDDEAA